MKTTIFYFLFFSFFNIFSAQSQFIAIFPGLEPSEDYFDIRDYKLEYNQKIKEKLFDGLADKYKVRMLVTPSFDAEYVFQIDEIIKDYQFQKYVVRFHKANSNIWYSKDYKKMKVKKDEASMSEDDILLLTEAFATVVDKVRYEKSNMIINDGTNYLLSVWDDHGWRSGNIRSPNEKEINNLIDVVENLVKQTQSKRNIKISETDRNILNEIINDFQKQPTSADYALLSKIIKVIEDNESEYCSKLKDSNVQYVESALHDIRETGAKNLAYHEFNKQKFKSFIQYYLEEFVSFNTFSGNYEDIEPPKDFIFEKEENIKNNIFQLILKEFD